MRGHIEKTGTKRRAQPLMATGGVVVAAERIERQIELGQRMRTIDANSDADRGRSPADRFDGQCQRRGRRDMARDDHPGARRDGGEDGVHNLFGIVERPWKRGDPGRRRPNPFAGPPPDADHRAVLVVVQNNFVFGRQWEAVRDDVHGMGRVFHENQRVLRRSQPLGQPPSGGDPRRLVQPGEKIHRLFVERRFPAALGGQHRFRRRPKRTVVQVNSVRTKIPISSPIVGGGHGRITGGGGL